jgi:glycosyltransferase involved in cell wall biosynthesis
MPIKVLHISKMKGVSGSENHLLTLLSGLDQHHFDVHLCILAEAGHIPRLREYKNRLEQAGVAVFFLRVHKYIDITGLWTLRNYILQERIDLVHTHLMHADFYGTVAAKFSGVSMIISSRHNDDRFRHNPLLIWVNRFLARRHSKIIVISDWVGTFLQEVEGIPAEKIVRIHYGLNPETVTTQADSHYVRQQFQIPERVPVIGTIGQLAEQKGQTYLLQAIKQLIPQFPDLRVLIIGAGKLRSQLEQQSKALGLEHSVIFTGYRKDAIKLLSGFDLFVFPSLWEGFGLVLLEAMALKKAIVASSVSAIPESVIDGKTGILVPPRHADRLAEAILMLLNDRHLVKTMGESGYEHLQEHFTVQHMIRATETVYTNVISLQSQRLSLL